MGKVISAAPDVKCEILTPKGSADFECGFWEFLLSAMNEKGPVDSLERIDASIAIASKLKAAKAAKAETATFENEEFKILDAAAKAKVSAAWPEIAREVRPFFRALEPKSEKNPGGAQDVELCTKK